MAPKKTICCWIKYEQEYINETADRIIKFMSGLNSTLRGL